MATKKPGEKGKKFPRSLRRGEIRLYLYFLRTILSLSLYMLSGGMTPRTQEVG